MRVATGFGTLHQFLDPLNLVWDEQIGLAVDPKFLSPRIIEMRKE